MQLLKKILLHLDSHLSISCEVLDPWMFEEIYSTWAFLWFEDKTRLHEVSRLSRDYVPVPLLE